MTALVHVVETLERGGLERMVCDLAIEQARRGMRVSVICIYRRGLLSVELENAGIEIYSADKSARGNLVALWRLRRRLRAAAPHIVHTHNATANYLTVLASLGLGLQIVCTRHGMGGGLGVDRREKYFKKSVSRTERVVTVCRHAANHFLGQELVPSVKLEVIGNGIVLSRFAQSNRIAARDALGLSAEGLVVGTVGRLNWAKDHNLFLDVAALLKAQFPGCRFVIIGSGEKRAELEREIERLGLGDSGATGG